MGAREDVDESCHDGAYTVDEAALRHGASVAEETNDARIAYQYLPASEPTPYRDGWLPD